MTYKTILRLKPTFKGVTKMCIALLGLTQLVNAQTFTPGNLAVFVAASNAANNTTGSIIELNTTTAGQSPVNTFTIDGTTPGTALRFSGSATSTGYLSNSNDGYYLYFTGGSSTTTSVNVNTITSRAVGSFNPAGTFAIATTYTGTSGNQTRCATSLDNSTIFVGDQGGFYSNGTSAASPTGNIRSVKTFGSSVYYFTAIATAAPVGTISAATGGTITALPGLTNGATTRTDFCLVSSGSNGSAYDVLYISDATSATVGAIYKYSLVSGSWVANGSYATTFGGFGLTAEAISGGANLYVSSGTGATATNNVVKVIDAAGYNTAISVTTGNNVTLYTAAAGTTVKGVAFAPVCRNPQINTLSNNGPICSGNNLTFSLTATGHVPLSYSWSGPNSFSSPIQNPTVTVAGSNASGTYIVSVVNSCSTTSSTSSATVNASPVSYSLTGGGSYCQGGSGLTIGVSSSDVGVNYQLKDGVTNIGAPIAGTGSAISFGNQTAASTYTVVATNSTSSCATNMSGNAVVVITSTVTPSISIAANPGSTICSGTNVTFSATPTNGGGAPTYQWTLNGSNIATGSSYSNNSLSTNDQVACVLTSNAACTTALTATSNTFTINVSSSVTPSVSIVSSGTSNCSGATVSFTATPSNGGITPSYLWKINGTSTAVTTSTFTTNTLANNDVVTCVLTSSDACASPASVTSNSITTTVIATVTPLVSVVATPGNTICAGTSVTFSATPTNGGTPFYAWTKNGSPVGGNNTFYTDASLSNNDVVVCTMTSNATCASPLTSANTTTMTVNALPTPSINGSLTFCTPGSTTLDAGAGYTSYLWSNGVTTQTVSISASGSYSVTVSNGSCNGTSSVVNVVGLTTPSAPGAFTASSSMVVLGQNAVAYSVPNDPTATSYTWTYNGAGATINGSANSVTIDFSGSATSGTLNVTASNACGTSSATSMSIVVALQPSFGSGNLVLLQTIGSISKAPSQITLKEITTSGTPGMTVTLPSSGNNAFQTSGIFGGSEGFLTTSTDKKYLVLAGYATNISTGDITATSAASTPRTVGLVYPSGYFQPVYSSTSFYDANDIRGAVSDGTNFWASGASGASVDGIDYFGPNTPAGLGTGLTPPKGYAIRIFNGQLYYSTQKAGPSNTVSQMGIFSFGTGLPTNGAPVPTQLINTGTTVVEDFSINPTTDVCYIAINLNTAAGGIQKWTKTGSVWSLAYTLGTGIANVGAYGLVVDYSGANPIIYATTFDAGGNRVIKITDTGAGSTATTILASSANVYYKGITFAPIAVGTPIVNLSVSANAGTEAGATVITVTANSSAVVSGTQTVSLNVSGTNITAGDYNLSNTVITIPSGGTSGTVTFTVVDDAVVEALIETATLTISNPSSGIILGSSTSQNIAITDNEADTPPTIVMNVATTTDYIDWAATSSPTSPFSVSGTTSDPTDPAKTFGIDFTINDLETAVASLTVTVVSSNTVIVPNANISVTSSGATRNIKMTPLNIGYTNITVSVFDGLNTASYVIYYGSSDPSPVLSPANTFWHTGLSDASDAVAIDDNYYMTGDDELDYINVYSRSHSGLPVVSFDATTFLGLPDPSKPETDIEGGTPSLKNLNRSYWMGSMSNGKAPFDNKPNRDRIFATHHTGTGAGTTINFVGYSAIKSALLTWGDNNGYNFTASAAAGVDSKQLAGFAAEGMVFAPDSTTLWIGLRAPLVPTANRTKAVLAPILNFETWFNNGSQVGSPTFGAPIELDLNLNGIRDIIRLSNGTYIIIAGSPLDAAGTNEIYKWTGNPSDAPIHVPSAGGGNINMEGVMEVHVGGNLSLNKLQVISDYGGNILYNDAFEAKDLGDLKLRKFRSDLLNSLDLSICNGTYSVSVNANGSTTFCQGDSVKLTAVTGSSPSTYSWSTGATTSAVIVHSSGNYSVTATDNYTGCSITTAATSVTVNSLPSVLANATSTVVCNGQPVTLTGGGASTYTWTSGVINGTAFTPTTTVTYTVSGTGINTCVNTATVQVVVNPIPTTPSISQAGNVLTSSAATSYQWYLNGGVINGATSQSYTVTQTGNYQVVISDANGCTAMSNTLIVNSTGVVALQKQFGINVLPNPFENNLEISFNAEGGNALIELYNSIGERVSVLFEGELNKGFTNLKFNSLPEMQNGMYFVKIQNGSLAKVLKVTHVK